MASTKISRTQASNGTKKLTISAWVKRTKTNTSEPNLGSDQTICSSFYSTSYYGYLRFNGSDQLVFGDYRTTTLMILTTNAVFRDTSAWYHIVATFDATVGSPQAKIYVNGVLQTLATNTNYSQNQTNSWNTDYPFNIGAFNNGEYLNGSLADFYYIQGQSYDASTFGETDATTGIWKPILNPTIDYSSTGTNSCHLKFEDASNLDLDSGANNLTFSTSGTLTKTEDCPSNVFAVYNQLLNIPSSELSNGATTILNASSASTRPILSSLGASSGKFYAEFKTVTASSASRVGICAMDKYVLTEFTGVNALSYGYLAGGTVANNNSTTISGLSSYTSGDIIGVYIDLDNNFLYFAKNGVLQNSGVPTSGATGTGGQAITANNTYGFHVTVGSSSKKTTANFGNGYFGTTVVASAGTNASSNGIFEYDVPTGYTALSTKGLNL